MACGVKRDSSVSPITTGHYGSSWKGHIIDLSQSGLLSASPRECAWIQSVFLYGQSVSWHIHAKHDPACVPDLPGTVGRCTTPTFTAKQLQTISQSRKKPIHHFGQQVITVEAFQPLYSLLIATVWITCQRNATIVTIIKKIKINKTTTPPPPPTKKTLLNQIQQAGTTYICWPTNLQ